ncbi:MAG: hypothetical protein R6U61_04980, partial [Thermoplasmata archaeon]
HHLRSLFYNNGIRDFDDDGDIDEFSPVITDFSPPLDDYSHIGIDVDAFDPDTEDQDFLEARFYYSEVEPTEENMIDWMNDDHHIGADEYPQDGFFVSWDSTELFEAGEEGDVYIISVVNDASGLASSQFAGQQVEGKEELCSCDPSEGIRLPADISGTRSRCQRNHRKIPADDMENGRTAHELLYSSNSISIIWFEQEES